ncbi:hypothetical protein EJ05DRAFT_532468 [Pseudovirgaria hyperparasitica]|uniref:Cytochrome b561 domain-containing protein n=1 Tax=Pseudovirgaria hyperparasitica TaxID=470096 RepID=A0A6A6W3L4_9PEZI|nr:uncharacterized protein EJ05DRAFT_532468 [Pseudovirgaria hyperparasitica]KAF2756520.1 hypothetical protein EJ05DRAFT_532468 [Pseudovirgaria hyperparasitica]
MSPNPQLAPAGSSTYNSDTMYVGDGTWDSSRNTFLLPNLVGLNFATMRYNGMGNRFLDMPGYHSIIKGHGIVAAITFLGVVPAAIMIAAFYHRNARMALRYHIWLQILTVLLSTVVFVLGWFAVGQARSLTNPHHGIGLTLYIFILLQATFGAWTHHREKGKDRIRIPFKLFLHQWVGRAIALLGFTQVALGLTLYGSPEVLFILFALWGFFLLVLYIGLSFHYRPSTGYYDKGSSIYSEGVTEITEERRSRRGGHGLGALAAAGGAGAALAALRRRSQSRHRSRERREVISSRHSSRSPRRSESVGREKYHEHEKKNHTWRNRLLGAGAGLGAIAAFRGLFNRRKPQEVESDVSSYRPPRAGASEMTQTDISRVEEGLAPASPANDRLRPHGRRPSVGPAAAAAAAAATAGASAASYGSPSRRASLRRRSGNSIDSYSSFSDERDEDDHDYHRRDFGIKEGLAVLGFAGFLKHKLGQRRRKKEDARVEAIRAQEIEKERMARTNSQRRHYTGDGTPGPRRGGRTGSFTDDDTDITGSTPALSRHHPPRPAQSSVAPPLHSADVTSVSSIAPVPAPPQSQGIPPPGFESGSEEYFSAGGRPHRRHHQAASSSAPPPAGASSSRRDGSGQRSNADNSMNSPPVSVKVKMHEDGRHVTLRRLNEEEARAEREHRRKERQQRGNRGGSVSSFSNVDDERWRRVAATEAAQAQQQQQQMGSSSNAPAVALPYPLPGPPPGPPPLGAPHPAAATTDHASLAPPPTIPAAGESAMGSSPPGTGTEMSRASNYEDNRRRRRAERARQRAERGGSRVEFT